MFLRAIRAFSSSRAAKRYTLPALPYSYADLEPYISGEIMNLHHSKHHQGYVDNLNVAHEKYGKALKMNDIATQVSLQPAIRFNGGGHINHSIFWETLAPKSSGGGELHDCAVKGAIEKEFGGLSEFISKFNGALAGIQGSGWGWLVEEEGKMRIVTTANQDPVVGMKVLLGIDAWEHAYYLQYRNVKGKYFDAVWEVINWKRVDERYSR